MRNLKISVEPGSSDPITFKIDKFLNQQVSRLSSNQLDHLYASIFSIQNKEEAKQRNALLELTSRFDKIEQMCLGQVNSQPNHLQDPAPFNLL